MKLPKHLPAATLLLCLAACGGENTSSNVQSPGAQESAKTKTLEAGAALMQDKAPVDALKPLVWLSFLQWTAKRARWKRITTAPSSMKTSSSV